MMPKNVSVTQGKKDAGNLTLSDSFSEPGTLHLLSHLIHEIISCTIGFLIPLL